MDHAARALETTAAAVASKVTGASSAVSVVSWYAAFDLGLWMGILIGILGLMVNLYFKQKADRRNTETHDAYMAQLNGGCKACKGFAPEVDTEK